MDHDELLGRIVMFLAGVGFASILIFLLKAIL